MNCLVVQTVKNLSQYRRSRFNPWVGKNPWRREWLPTPIFLPGESHRQRSPNLKIHWKDWSWNWKSNSLATWCEEPTHWKRPWCWKRLKAKGEEGSKGWDGWVASLTQWTWVWVNSRSWWWIGKPGMLQSMGSQRVRHTEQLNWLSSKGDQFFFPQCHYDYSLSHI